MIELPAENARHLADEMDNIENAIRAQNDLKAAWSDTAREALKAAGFVGPEIAVEFAKLKGAIKRRWTERKDPEKAAKAAEKAEGIETYFDVITAEPRARTRGTTKLALVQTEVVTPHDADTGEIIDDASGVVGLAERLRRLAVAGDADALQVIATAPML